MIDDESASLLSALVQDFQLALPVEDVGEPMAPHEKVLFFSLQLGVERCCPLRLRVRINLILVEVLEFVLDRIHQLILQVQVSHVVRNVII